jgi:hypothetical protein
MLVIVALANKMARIVWALLAKGGIYRLPPQWCDPLAVRGGRERRRDDRKVWRNGR